MWLKPYRVEWGEFKERLGHMDLLPAQGQAQGEASARPLDGWWPRGRGWALSLGPGESD